MREAVVSNYYIDISILSSDLLGITFSTRLMSASSLFCCCAFLKVMDTTLCISTYKWQTSLFNSSYFKLCLTFGTAEMAQYLKCWKQMGFTQHIVSLQTLISLYRHSRCTLYPFINLSLTFGQDMSRNKWTAEWINKKTKSSHSYSHSVSISGNICIHLYSAIQILS